MSKNEKFVPAVLIVCLCLWMTEKVHGILAALVALMAICLLMGLKIFKRSDFKPEVAWDAAVFIGCIINIAAVFPYLIWPGFYAVGDWSHTKKLSIA